MVNIIKDKEEVKSVMNIIQAFADGKTIQAIDPYDDEWCNQTKLNFEALFDGQYRIKPEPKYRPFKNAEECWQEMQKHKPFGWIYDGSYYYSIVSISNETINIVNDTRDIVDFLFSEIFEEDYTFADGTLFGVKVEE